MKFFPRRPVPSLIAAVVVVALVVGVIWRIHSSRNPANTATVYAGYLAAVAIAVTLLMALGTRLGKGRRGAAAQAGTPTQVAAAADWLAEEMAYTWRLEETRRRIVTPAPATVRWRWAADDVTSPRRDVTTPPAPGTGPPPLPDLGQPGELLGSGVVTRLHDEVYAQLPHGRLVLLGGPGAGKTGAMILLLLAALDRRATLTKDQRAQVPVPAWLTLGGWDPATTTMQEWAVGTLNRDFPALRATDYGPDAAGELLRGGKVALFLDGLDEMPDGVRAQALIRVDEEARGMRVVITSRPEEYRHALRAGRPDNTAVIEMRPVRPHAAAAYLLRDQAGPNRQRWEKVGAYLMLNPGSVAAGALDNPLMLSLARDTYTTKDPGVLIAPGSFPTVDALRKYLIGQVLFSAYPDEHQRAYATRWLAWIAHHMGTSRDLPWWYIPTWIRGWQIQVACALVTGLVIGLVAGLAFGFGFGPGFGLAGGLVAGLVGGLLAGLLAIPGEPYTLAPHWPPLQDREDFKVVGQMGLLAAFWIGIIGWRLGLRWFVIALVVGLGSCLWLGVAFGIRGLIAPIADSPSATPAGTYRADRSAGMLYGSMASVWSGLGVATLCAFMIRVESPRLPGVVRWSVFGHVGRLPGGVSWSVFGLVLGLVLGLVYALVAGLAFGFATRQTFLVKLTELALTCQGRGPVHFLRLLEDASDLQVLRQAGAVYQFRHAALQDHLAAMYYQPANAATAPSR